ncbi:hypothetical protein OG323_37165 (plasmid) [Streptomyces cyaneofuscatus]|uniref:hypothetical protein n=1 Tax=Streptomyces cyaneofuscatus TaxID=66883 RepID=UPI002F91895D|nr:hypothetical protein OG323_00065 [Streptomyces cyaneofuscatus]WTA94215.1 hypothetical protein OG323_37040 [Streptomyces cyaneofuscatus]WTA94659.1 hypothetical protein OG323_37165 [Streptomyces cyaneofuscatus]
MTSAIDALLADAAMPVSDARTFDVAAALRRLAADARQTAPTPEITRSTQAGQRLSVISRWVLNEPDAAVRMSHIAEDPEHSAFESDEQLDVDGALVFACLLNLTGHPESAQFWWQLAAGAGSRAAMYCLHLHHLKLGEAREARHWYHQLMESTSESAPPDATFIEGLEIFARYIRTSGHGATALTGQLESEVDRLATTRTGTGGIIRRPDRRLVDQLHEFADRS